MFGRKKTSEFVADVPKGYGNGQSPVQIPQGHRFGRSAVVADLHVNNSEYRQRDNIDGDFDLQKRLRFAVFPRRDPRQRNSHARVQ